MSVFKDDSSPYWQYEFQRDRRRFRGSFNGKKGRPRITTDRPEGEATRAEALLDAAADQSSSERPRLTLHDAAARYWTEVAQFFKDASGEWGRLAHLERILGKHKYIDQLTDSDLSAYVAKRRTEKARHKETNVSNSTINRELEALGRILKRCKKPWRVRLPEDVIEMGPHKLPEKERVRALTSDEDKRLFDAIREIRPDFEDMIDFALVCGKRLSEVIFLEKAKVDFRGMTARVIQKGGEEIVIALTEYSAAILKRNWMHHPTRCFTFINQANKTYMNRGTMTVARKGLRRPFTKDGWRKPWKKILERAKIDDFRFHDMRHTCLTRVLAATGNLKAVQEAADHKSITSSARYAHFFADQKRAALQAAEAFRLPEKSRKAGGRKSKRSGDAER